MSSIVDLRPGEGRITAWMFAYAFAAMTAYNIVQPVTRSTFITDLGADNLPYVLLATGFVIGLIMQGYARIVATLPERWALPSVQLTMAVVLAAFFVLLQIGGSAFTVAFYVFGQILGTLLLSQFWTLANDLYDPRQARRLFGFIGGGVSLGGMAGSGFAALVAGRIGTAPLLLFSTATLVGCAAIVTVILRQTAPRNRAKASPGSSPAEANDGEWTLVRQSANLRSIAMLISLAAVAAMVVDQQLSLAAEQVHGGDEDAVTGFLASVRFFLSAASLLIQLVLVRHIYRLLGIGVAVMMLPVALGASSVLILMTGAIWAAAVASTIDRSIRYTVDRTTREILFLPLDSSVRLRVKSFVDVTVDRGARAAGALLVLVAIKPWGLALSWPRLSVITLTLVAVWLVLAVRARDRYVAAIRRGLELQAVKPDEISVGVADLTTVEALLEELAHPDERLTSFIIQVWLTSRIHRYLGIGVALLILPIGLGASGVLILLTGALGAAAFGRVLDSALRYSLDKTTREILFLPLPAHLRQPVKPFVDVTVDRAAKAALALLVLVLIQPWGFNLGWRELSFVTLTMVGIWIYTAVQARRGYLESFRETIEQRGMEPADVRLSVADLSTVETLVEELAHPDEQRVLYAIDVLEALDKRHLVTPLLLHHEAAAVRARAVTALRNARTDIAERWVPTIEKMIGDDSPQVRAAAIGTLAGVRNESGAGIARSLLGDHNPRIVATAAVVLAGSDQPSDQSAAQKALASLAADTSENASVIRRDLAGAIRQVGNTGSHDLLIPLLHDPDPEVADEAMRSLRSLGATDFMFAPTLISLLGNRRLKSGARETLVGYGPGVVDILKYFLTDPEEDIWVRRHIPATLARIPCQASMDVLIDLMDDPDGFLRFKVVAAVEKLRRGQPSLTFKREPVENAALREGRKYFNRLGLHHNLFVRADLSSDCVLAHALSEKLDRTVDRIYRLLGLLYPWKDIAAARWAIERGDNRARANSLEYLDNVLSTQLRHRVLPSLEDTPVEEKVRRGNVLLKTRPRDVEETLLELINDDDQVVAASAIDLVGHLEMWSLSDDVEHVLAHRDPKDWYVFEAASWTLAAQSLSAHRRRERWVEPLPAASLATRMRSLPLFALVGVDEIFRIVGTGHQARHDTGTTLLREGAVPETVHLLLDGQLVASARRSGAREVDPPAALGFEEALDGCLMTETFKTGEPSVSIALSVDQLRTLLSDNTDLVQGLFRTLADRRQVKPGFIKGDDATELERLTGALTPIQKALALQRIPIFRKVSGPEMLYLASIARQITLEPDAVLADESGAFGLGILLSGEVALTTADAPEPVAQARAGDSLGVYETLAGMEPGSGLHQLRLVVSQPGAALQIEREELFDLLGQRPDMLQQIFAAIFDRGASEQTTNA